MGNESAHIVRSHEQAPWDGKLTTVSTYLLQLRVEYVWLGPL